MKTRLIEFTVRTLMSVASLAQAAPAFAAEVEMTSDHVKLTEEKTVLVRTKATPKKVKVDLPVAISRTYCAEHGTEIVFGPSPACGQEEYLERVVVNRCVRIAKCTLLPNGEKKDCECVERKDVVEHVVRTRNRSCNHPVTVCVRTAVATNLQEKRIVIEFKKAAKLSSGESELFELSGEQLRVDGDNINFHLEVLKSSVPYKTSSKERMMFTDKIVVERQ